MNRKARLIIATIVTLVLTVVGTTVWAGSKESSLGPILNAITQDCNTSIKMGDVTITLTVAGEESCTFTVSRLKVPNTVMGGAPDGLEFRSDAFEVSGPANRVGMLEVCFAYSPQDEDKNAQIYALFGKETAILPDVKTGTPAQLCAATDNLSGIFALVGNP